MGKGLKIRLEEDDNGKSNHIKKLTEDVKRVAGRIVDLFPGHSLDHTIMVSCHDEFIRDLLEGNLRKKGYRVETSDCVDVATGNVQYNIKIYRTK